MIISLSPSLVQTLHKEIQGHQPRIDDIHRRGQAPQSAVDGERQLALEGRLVELRDLWSQLIAETDERRARLVEANRAQQFYTDAAEAEAWMGEQELHMMSEEKAKVCVMFSKIFSLKSCSLKLFWLVKVVHVDGGGGSKSTSLDK